MTEKERAAAIDRLLAERYPPVPLLRFTSPFTLLVAAILAAQCTDERVNRVTETLFERFPGPEAFAEADLAALEEAVHPTGFYRQKAKTLKAVSEALVQRFGGELPASVEELTTLPGVGRKTANLVLGNSMGVPGVFVDTHVGRLAGRMGLSGKKKPDDIEADLSALLPPARWSAFSNLLTHLGREFCTARKARCAECPASEFCPKIGVEA